MCPAGALPALHAGFGPLSAVLAAVQQATDAARPAPARENNTQTIDKPIVSLIL